MYQENYEVNYEEESKEAQKQALETNVKFTFMNTLNDINFNEIEKALDKQMLVIPAKKEETVDQYLIVMDGNIVYGKDNTFIAASYDKENGELDKYSLESTDATKEDVLEAQHMDVKTFLKNLKKIERGSFFSGKKEKNAEKKGFGKVNYVHILRNRIA